MPTAEGFLEAFIKKYNEKHYENQEQWEVIWTDTYNWSNFIIECVIKSINYENLRCHNGEPLRLDAVFTGANLWDWFPISIALEHENNPIGVHGEIKKLISIDCPLKVLITYSLIGEKEVNWVKEKIRKSFFESLHRTDHLLSRNSEYLFIIGKELHDKPKELSWEYAICRHHFEGNVLNWHNI